MSSQMSKRAKMEAAFDKQIAKMKQEEIAAGKWCTCGHSLPTHDVGYTCQSTACKCLVFKPSDTQPAAPSPTEASTPSDRYVGTLTFNRPLKLEYLEAGGKHGLFEGNLLVAVVGECCPDHAESFAREIQKRVNEREELICNLKAAIAYLEDDSRSERRRQACLASFRTVLAKTSGD